MRGGGRGEEEGKEGRRRRRPLPGPRPPPRRPPRSRPTRRPPPVPLAPAPPPLRRRVAEPAGNVGSAEPGSLGLTSLRISAGLAIFFFFFLFFPPAAPKPPSACRACQSSRAAGIAVPPGISPPARLSPILLSAPASSLFSASAPPPAPPSCARTRPSWRTMEAGQASASLDASIAASTLALVIRMINIYAEPPFKRRSPPPRSPWSLGRRAGAAADAGGHPKAATGAAPDVQRSGAPAKSGPGHPLRQAAAGSCRSRRTCTTPGAGASASASGRRVLSQPEDVHDTRGRGIRFGKRPLGHAACDGAAPAQDHRLPVPASGR